MKKTPVTLALAAAIALGLPGCTMFMGALQNGTATATTATASVKTAAGDTIATGSDKTTSASRFRFNYDVSNRAGVGVLRAFDDRTSTIIQFVDLDRQNPTIYDSKGKTLPYNRIGQYAIVSGLHPWLAVTVLGEQAIVTNNGYDAADPAAQISALRASETESAAKLAATEAELERAKKELAQVQAQLTQRDANTEAVIRRLDVIETRINGLDAKPTEAGRARNRRADKFQMVEKSARPSAAAATAQSPKTTGGLHLVSLSYIGEPEADIAVISGFGRDMKLLDAIKQIAPDGWQVFIKEDLLARADQFRAVSWRGGRRWVEVLDILANDHDLAIDVDWSKSRLYVGGRKIAGSVSAQRAEPAWVAKTGSTLRESVNEWAEKAGWQIVWRANYDYPILAQLTFGGTFIDAIVSIFRSYEKSERPLLVDVYESQKLVVISPRE